VKSDRVAEKQRLATYYDDEQLAASVQDVLISGTNGTSQELANDTFTAGLTA
jgi:hypothetical protein